ncbi:hypothetical protein C9374_013431 [Naegleria lovaniensis]|uniref:C2 domain-containing protein n=1 Tax=Naegleria lovaniensis TaxID=51637 RepID=A0AA88H2N6_NAELO|nr:uncharacterized protein C9374_013431 [Naegleria lovaniensis]KAG2391946.1 hypothetical protein C9374_013431 [Naegleria lovaniensis]
MSLKAGDHLCIGLVRCHNLQAADLNGFSDPYVIISTSSQQHQRTEIIKKTLNPVYDERFSFLVDKDIPEMEINFKVMDWDRLTADDFLGSAKISINDSKYPVGHVHTEELTLEKTKSGTLTITIHIVRGTQLEKVVPSEHVESSKFKLLSGYFGPTFAPCIPECFKMISNKISSTHALANFTNDDQTENITISYNYDLKELGFDESREVFMSTMMKMQESMSNRFAKGTYKVFENGKQVNLLEKFGIEGETKFQQVNEYHWQFTNTQIKLVKVWTFVCKPLTNPDGMVTFIYYSDDHSESSHPLKECALKTVVK